MCGSQEGIKPVVIKDTNLAQATFVMKMEKESADKSAEKSAESADSKNMKGM